MLEKYNIKKAINMLRVHSDNRQIIIDDITKLDKYTNYLGACTETHEKIFIYINYSFPEDIQEQVVIHEILHIILGHEGFPRVIINDNLTREASPEAMKIFRYMRDQFHSVIEHPQVFSREINDFDFDLDNYFNAQVEIKKDRFERRANRINDKSDYFVRQQDILIGLDYYSYPEKHRKIIQKMFRNLYPEAYKSCRNLWGKLKFNNPQECYKSAQRIKKHIIRYGRKKKLLKTNIYWVAQDIIFH